MAKKTSIKIRQTTRADIDQILALNKIVYSSLEEEGVVWGSSHIRSHLKVFPQGQIVAEINGRIVGGACSLIVNLGRDPLRVHTWAGITDSGFFTNHDPDGDTLYGADVYVHPDFRGKGIGRALYEERRRICRRLNLRRILIGGRLWNYPDHSDKYSPDEYVQRVVSGEINDVVLSLQLKEGFFFRRLIPNYVRDERSHNNAPLVEWLNPDFKPIDTGVRKVRITCVQYKMRKIKAFTDFTKQIEYFVDIAANYNSDFVLFPEFLTVQLLSSVDAKSSTAAIKKLTTFTPKFRDFVKKLAMRYGLTIIAGSHPIKLGSKICNVALVCLPDGSIVEQPKIHITPNEKRWWGISGGSQLEVINTPKAKIGVQICYDIEFPEAARVMSDLGAEIIFVPFCTDNRQGYLRVRCCAQARAIENQVYVAMAGSVGNLPDVENMDVNYAQAAVFTPSDFAFARDGIAAEADSNEETVLVCDLDLNDLHNSITYGTVTPRLDRRPDLFQVNSIFSQEYGGKEKQAKQTGDQPLGDQRILKD